MQHKNSMILFFKTGLDVCMHTYTFICGYECDKDTIDI